MNYYFVCVFVFGLNFASYLCVQDFAGGDKAPSSSSDAGGNLQTTVNKLQPLFSSLAKEFEPVIENVKQGGNADSIKSSLQKVDLNSIMQKVKDSDFGPTLDKLQTKSGSLFNSFMGNLNKPQPEPQNRQKRKIHAGCTFLPDWYRRH